MTVVLVTAAQRFTGLSSDTKPTAGVRPGATFYESDTLTTFIFDGSAWSQVP